MGDPACFLDATCLTCGRFLEPEDHSSGFCRCGEPIDDGSVVTGDLHSRLREDLLTAMRDRDRDRVAALRLAVAALDNAGAVAIDDRGPAMPPHIGLGGDVDRLPLGEGEDHALLRVEVEHLVASARGLETAGRSDEAGRQRRMADVLARYL